jgi:hypothetical protein
VLCGTCKHGFYRSIGGKCESCSETTQLYFVAVLLVLVLVLTIVRPLLVRWMRAQVAQNSKVANLYKTFRVQWAKWNESVIVVAKQLCE